MDAIKGCFVGEPEDRSMEDIRRVEALRRKVLEQGRNEGSFWSTLCHFHGTVVSSIIHNSLFWLVIVIYWGIRVWMWVGSVPTFLATLASADVGLIGGFLSFFLIFFVGQSYNRFHKQYSYSMSCEGRIFDVATTAAVALPRERAVRLVRYMNAAHAAGYVGLSRYYPYSTFFKELNAQNRFLTDQEVERMEQINMDVGGSCYREIICWCIAEISSAVKAGYIKDPLVAAAFKSRVLSLRGSIGALYDYDDQPVTFFYIHFLTLLIALYLPLFSLSTAIAAGTGEETYWLSDVVRFLTVLLQAIFTIGLRILGSKLALPYGDDIEDLSVMHYINFTWRMSNRILATQFPDPISVTVEADILRERASIGDAWPFSLEEAKLEVIKEEVDGPADKKIAEDADE
mmetsp:Transcript_11508/g.31031  ORF Transcript_11508/g.31031 Transcript_11508/m.31031 type:complete len:401 (+) Transcript_11508:189-1391(+)